MSLAPDAKMKKKNTDNPGGHESIFSWGFSSSSSSDIGNRPKLTMQISVLGSNP